MLYDEEEMIRQGSAVGPITAELIAEAKRKCFTACRLAGDRPKEAEKNTAVYWPDFIPEARKSIGEVEEKVVAPGPRKRVQMVRHR